MLTTAANANIELAGAREAVAPMATIQTARDRDTINARGRNRRRCLHNRHTAPADLHAADNNEPDGAKRKIKRHREPTARRHAPIRLNRTWVTRNNDTTRGVSYDDHCARVRQAAITTTNAFTHN